MFLNNVNSTHLKSISTRCSFLSLHHARKSGKTFFTKISLSTWKSWKVEDTNNRIVFQGLFMRLTVAFCRPTYFIYWQDFRAAIHALSTRFFVSSFDLSLEAELLDRLLELACFCLIDFSWLFFNRSKYDCSRRDIFYYTRRLTELRLMVLRTKNEE